MILVIIILVAFRKTREQALIKLKLLKKKMIWNGAILYFQISFLQQGFVFSELLKKGML